MNKFFNSANRDTLIEYFKFKEKNGYKFNEEELSNFIDIVKEKILKINNDNKFSTVFIPETGNLNLIRLAEKISYNIVFVKKNKKQIIIDELNKQTYQKKEKEALFDSISKMDTIKMADVKGNQRKRFVDCLFENNEFNDSLYENSLFLDDSSFSSYTYQAAKQKIKKTNHTVILFFKA
jgi:hypothetical protein